MPTKRTTTVVCTTAVAALLATVVPTSATAAEDTEVKTLVIGVDGATFDFLDDADMPNLDALRERGMTAVSNLYANPMAGTISGPGWTSIATGTWPDKHNVINNNFTAPNLDEYPDYLSRIEAAQPERDTAVVATWGPIVDNVYGTSIDSRVKGGNDAGTAVAAAAAVTGGADDLFVHLDEVDGAGHSAGTNGAAYLPALAKVDSEIGQILDAVEARPDSEDWLIVVTADHGHTPTGGHGGNSAAERETFVIAAGAGITPGERTDVKIADIAPTVLDAVGIDIDRAWKLDGMPIEQLEADEFDTLRSELQTRQDETRPGASVLGWTHATPEGWSIDNSNMPSGGVTEWAGWSFATDEFWTAVELGQGRETSVRARDVFAVADSDEWDDKAHGAGAFDSTLVSPAYELNGASTATLAYTTNYVIDGPQSAEVLVSFDGGEPVSLKDYAANTNANEELTFDVPAGATTAQFRFHYTGTNSAFWVVDRVALGQPEAPVDTTRPVATLVSPSSSGPVREVQIQVDATDDTGLQRIVANIYQGTKLVKSTQTALDGAASGTHAATVSLRDGDYTVKFNAQDLAGNIAKTGTFPFTVDATAPTATVKNGANFTVSTAEGVYEKVSFKLHDAGKVSRIELNGVMKDLSDNAWSDLNFVKPGTFGAVAGENTLVVYDVAGNAKTVTFTLD